MALRIAKRILRKNLVDFLPIGKDIEIIEIEVSDRMVGKTIVDMDLRRRYSLNVIAIHHEEQIETDVRPDCRLCHGDTITVIGKEENVTRFARRLLVNALQETEVFCSGKNDQRHCRR